MTNIVKRQISSRISKMRTFRTSRFCPPVARSPLFSCLGALCLVLLGQVAHAQACTAQDQDCDGIPDSVEARLLETYSPYLKFSRDNGSNETFRPADVGDYLRTSEIDGSGSEGDKVWVSHTEMSTNPAILITLSKDGNNSTVLKTPKLTSFHVNPSNDVGRRGAPWPQVLASRRTGLYGHVVPVYLSSSDQYDRAHVPSSADAKLTLFYKIEYWQFFGYSSNNKPLDEGDHEADWDTIQLIVQPNGNPSDLQGAIRTVLFYAHGQEMAFDMSSKTGSAPMDNGAVLEIRGSNYNQPVPDLHDSGASAKARNHVLQLYFDSTTRQFTHPVVYVEHGGHEFWPSAYWGFIGAQKHGGDDTTDSYLTAAPPNLGEVEHPLAGDPMANPIVQFNGYWGTYSRALPGIFSNNPPPGPPLHYEWTYPPNSSIRWQLQGMEY